MPFAIVPIKPKNQLIDAGKLRTAVQKAMDEIAEGIRDDLNAPAAGWRGEHQPQFTVRSNPSYRIISTRKKVYIFQNDGTRPHEIWPKRARRLVFQVPSGTTVFARMVNHPGTKPQNWTMKVAEKWQRIVPGWMQQAIEAAGK